MMEYRPITVVVAVDHPMFRRGLCDTIEESTPYIVIGEAADGDEALRLILEKKPAIAILDIEMPKVNGLDVAERIDAATIPVRVIILTMYEEYALFNRALDAGVKGYMLKESAVADILSGISRVAEGDYYFSPSLSGYLMKRAASPADRFDPEESKKLTGTELQIVTLIGHSLSSREIADKLGISIRTIETHRHNICRKLNLNGSYALLRYAMNRKPPGPI